MTSTYTLTATLGDERETVRITEDDATAATFVAIARVLDRAMDSRLWAVGRIELTDPTGAVIQHMPAKSDTNEGA